MKRPPFPDWLQRDIPFHPWSYFWIFLISLSLLSYAPPSLPFRPGIVFFGLVLPLAMGLVIVLRERKKGGRLDPFCQNPSRIPFWIWTLFILLFLTIHFYRLVSLPFWPLSDEGIFSTFALGLLQKWRWTLLWTQGRMEPFLLWFLWAFFRIAGPSLLSLRLFTTFFSIAGALAAYGAARLFLSPFLSFVFCWLFSLSFWEIAMARQCTPNDLIPFFQLTAFILIGIYWKSKGKRAHWFWITALGAWCGAGFYTYTNWTVVWLFGAAVLLAMGFQRRELPETVLFFILSLSIALPLVFARSAPGAMDYLQSNFSGFLPFHSLPLYLRGLFWDGKESYPLGPIWGGYLDAATGALILTGLLYAVRQAEWKIVAGGGLGIFLSLLPGILTHALELQRVTPSLVFFILLGALGIQCLVTITAPAYRKAALLGLALAPVFLNSYHLFRLYGDIQLAAPIRQWRNVEYFSAYQILRSLSRQSGPVYVFSEFNTDYDNKTLDIADYPFNAIENPSLSNSRPSWTCVITNTQYAPYFIKSFPGLRFDVLKTDKNGPDDPKPFGIFLIPTSQIPAAMLEGWKRADNLYREFDFEIKNKMPGQRWASFMEADPSLSARFSRDLFLTAVYWEKMAFFKYLDGWFIQATQAYRNAIRQGIPAAHLYYDLGVCLKIQGRTKESGQCFKKASVLSAGKAE